MGLINKVEKLKRTEITSKGYHKEDDKDRINHDVIRDHYQSQIKREEAEVDEPSHEISAVNGRLQIKRPKKFSSESFSSESISLRMQETETGRVNFAEDRINSGVPGLDGVMEGGFKNGSVNLIGGGAGSGKSIFCMQFLAEGIRQYNENGVYISFEQEEAQLIEDFARFKWSIKKYVKDGRLGFVYITPEQIASVLSTGAGSVIDLIKSINAKRVVIDSLSAYTLLHESEHQRRREVLKLIESIQKWGVTALMTSEQEPDPDKHHSTVLEFEVDGVILLYNIRKGDIRERSLEVFKMRGTEHSAKMFPMKITENGIVIFPEDAVF